MVCSSVGGYGESFTAYYSDSHSLFPSLCPTSCLSLFVYFSLFDKKMHHLPVSNFPFSPPFLYSLAATLFRISPLPPPCLYFVWLTSVIICLPLVFCFVYVVSFGLLFCASQGKKNPYTCQRVVEATLRRLSGPSGATAILHTHFVYTPTRACLPEDTCTTF